MMESGKQSSKALNMIDTIKQKFDRNRIDVYTIAYQDALSGISGRTRVGIYRSTFGKDLGINQRAN